MGANDSYGRAGLEYDVTVRMQWEIRLYILVSTRTAALKDPELVMMLVQTIPLRDR